MSSSKVQSRLPMPEPLLAATILRAMPHVVHGFTVALPARAGDSFTTALQAGVPAGTLRVGAPCFTLKQVHSAELVTFPPRAQHRSPVGQPTQPTTAAGAAQPCADGAILTEVVGVVAVQTADCVPILAVHRDRGEVAALHAGWRGAAAGILPNLLRRWLGPDESPEAIQIAFGPAIRACCYEVRADCTDAFDPLHLHDAVIHREGRMFLELTRVLANQAAALGLPEEAIETLPHCTSCSGDSAHRPFASYRRDGRPGQPYAARNGSFIGFSPR